MSSHSGRFDEQYELLRELARGGMGIVYLARQRATGAEVVVKTLQASLDEASRQRFEREAQVLANLNHPHIVRVHDCGVLQGWPYLVMAYIQGEEWKSQVEAELASGGLPKLDATIEVLAQVASALEYCHARGVAHRDLKPSNIFLDADTGRALLLDFGLVKAAGVDSQGLTRTGELLGTPHYMSPERFDSSASAHPAESGDIWAFGVTAWYGLTGQLPFEGGSAVELMAKIHAARPAALRRLRKDLPRWLCELCEDCLARDPEDRPSAAELSQRLRERSARPRSRRPLLAASLLLLAALAAGGAQWLPREPAQLRLEPAPAVQREASAILRGQVANADALWLRSAAGRKPLSFDETGAFELSLPLEPGENRLSLAALGDGEPARIELTITRDVEPPRLELEPVPARVFEPELRLRGTLSEPGCRVEVNGEATAVEGLEMRATVSLKPGLNRLRVSVEDPAGHRLETEREFSLSPRLRVGPGESLAALVAGLREPTQVLIAAGRYDENVIVRQPGVELVADGEVILASATGSSLRVEASQVTVRGLTLLTESGLLAKALLVDGGEVRCESCRFEGGSGVYGAWVGPEIADAKPPRSLARFVDCDFIGSGTVGLTAARGSEVIVEGGRFEGWETWEAEVDDEARLLITGARFKGVGTAVQAESVTDGSPFARLVSCGFEGYDRAVVSQGDTALVELEECRIAGGRCQVVAYYGGAARLDGCELRGADKPLWVHTKGRVEARGCRFIDNHQLVAENLAELILEGCELREPRGEPPHILYNESARGALRGCAFEGYEGSDILSVYESQLRVARLEGIATEAIRVESSAVVERE